MKSWSPRIAPATPRLPRPFSSAIHAQLIALIRRQAGWRIKAAEDSIDVAQSVLRSFFGQLRGQSVEAGAGDNFWPLLATIALNKIRNRGKFWQRECRDPTRVQSNHDESARVVCDPLERGPTPDDVVVLEEMVSLLLDGFTGRRRQIVQLLLEGCGTGEIARSLGTSERTVYVTRQLAATHLKKLVGE